MFYMYENTVNMKMFEKFIISIDIFYYFKQLESVTRPQD